MSFSWTYLTRRFLLQNYRDALSVALIGSFFTSKFLNYVGKQSDNYWALQKVYTDDESDIYYREQMNKTDGAVKRDKTLWLAEKIKHNRANRERELMLDAFNYLNQKEHKA